MLPCELLCSNDLNQYAFVSIPIDLAVDDPLGDRESLVTRTRALDRLLQWGFYAVPHWHSKFDRVAYRSWLMRPERSPKNGVDITTWWARDGLRPALADQKGDTRRR